LSHGFERLETPRATWPLGLAAIGLIVLVVVGSLALAAVWFLAIVVVAGAVYLVRDLPPLQVALSLPLAIACFVTAFLGGLFLLPAALALLAIALTGGVASKRVGSLPE
jgi:hypothetical protein